MLRHYYVTRLRCNILMRIPKYLVLSIECRYGYGSNKCSKMSSCKGLFPTVTLLMLLFGPIRGGPSRKGLAKIC